MAFNDGMLAISKLLKISALVVGSLGCALSLFALGNDNSFSTFLFFWIPILLVAGALWVAAWVIGKFIE